MSALGEQIYEQYHVRIPFFDGTLEEAKHEAHTSIKYLVVYLHCPTHENTQSFLQTVLADDEVIAHLSEDAVLYGASVQEKQGNHLAVELQATTYPYIAVLFRKTVVMRLGGSLSKKQFLREWSVNADLWDGMRAADISLRADREQSELARLNELSAMDAMEKADMQRLAQLEQAERDEAAAKEAAQREAEAKHERELQASKTAAEEDRRALEEEHAKTELLATVRQTARSRLPPEPPAETDPSTLVFISIKSLSGKQYQRRFFRTDLVQNVEYFALSLEEYAGGKLQYVTGFPPRPLTWKEGVTTFGQVPALCPRAVVLLRLLPT